MVDYVSFKAEVKKKLALKGWKYADLAKASGYSVSTIESLMCGARATDNVCKAVAQALDIPEHLASQKG